MSFQEFLYVGKALKTQLTNTITPIYIALLKNELTVFNNVNIIKIMEYLYISYCKVNDIELEKHRITMMITYKPKLPILILDKQIKVGHNFTRSGNKYITGAIIISKEINLLINYDALTNNTK